MISFPAKRSAIVKIQNEPLPSADIPPRREVSFVFGSGIVRVSRSSRTAPRFHGGTGLTLVCNLRAVPLTILADAADGGLDRHHPGSQSDEIEDAREIVSM